MIQNTSLTCFLFFLLFLSVSLSLKSETNFIGLRDDGLCEGNRFLFLSTYVLGRQQDLTLTIDEINKTAKIEDVTYSDQPFRTYRIFNITQSMTYLEGKQTAELLGQNVLKVSNGTLRVNFVFQWEKVQLGTSLFGNGTGTVGSDQITYEKTLQTNTSHELQWHLSRYEPITVTNGISLSTMQPYRELDYEILSNMLNKLKTGEKTVKDNLIRVVNANYESILTQKVLEDEV